MSPRSAHRRRWVEALAFGLLVAVVLRVTHVLMGRVRVKLGDETLYIAAGLHPDAAHPIAQSSPLAGGFYRALSVFEPDPERLYYLGWFTLTAALPILLYVLARRSGAPLWSAMFVSLGWSLSGASFVWPSVSKIATVVLALGAIATTFARGRFVRWLLAAMTLVIAASARPELAPFAFALACGVLLWGITTRRGERPSFASGATAAFALSTLVSAMPGTFSDNRSFSAFEQHYALNVSEAQREAGEDPIDPWNDSDRVVRADFGDVSSVHAAALANRGAFLWHVRQNVARAPAAVARVLGPYRRLGGAMRAGLFASSGVVALFAVVRLARSLLRRGRGFAGAPPWAPLLVCVTLAALLSSVVVHPREHYFVAPLFLLAAFAASAARGVRWPASLRARSVGALVPVAAAASLLLAPTASYPSPRSDARTTVLRNTAATVRGLGLRGPITVLEGKLGHATLAGLPFRAVYPSERESGQDLWSFLDERGVEVVILDEELRAHPEFADELDEDEAVEEAGRARGFDAVWVEGTEVLVLVRRPRA